MAELTYPDPAAVLAIHDDLVAGQPNSEPGVRKPAAVESALSTVSVGHFGNAPETVHETATALLRLLVAEHPFVDGNKRTALNTAVVLYEMNGYALPYADERIRSILKRFGVDAVEAETAAVTASLRSTARPLAAPRDDERLALVDRIDAASGETRVNAVRRLAALDGNGTPRPTSGWPPSEPPSSGGGEGSPSLNAVSSADGPKLATR